MTLSIHIVTGQFPPTAGGLELWTQELAANLAPRLASVTIYVTGDQREIAAPTANYEIVSIGRDRSVWERSIEKASWSEARKENERARLNFLLLRNAISDRVERKKESHHIIVSNFAMTVGQLAMLVADDLALPHVTTIVGTDFSRGFRNLRERISLREVCQSARLIVCKSTEQSNRLSSLTRTPIITIPTSVNVEELLHSPEKKTEVIRLIADSGLSYHKGSDVLINAFLTLLEANLPVTLKIYGKIEEHQKDYWESRLKDVQTRAGQAFSFMNYVSRDEIYTELLHSSIYCSATLGEGSSAARIQALCSGIPIVTTRCGEFAGDVTEVADHIRLARIADSEDYTRQLNSMALDMLAGHVSINHDFVWMWRKRFAPAREWASWVNAFEMATKDSQ
ncbi:glycosyltransferase family 4 protein [Solimicrobium silvestre]|uniref:Glycosyl transferases group 1 n=1 Tax=Solimicrobium silvestre TaxID=2099400 RepID=A0A2S9H2Y7_9BURK|nr:glycosyltransferase family 4 protein [Solimicrobium silvestre]PRC94349.1 Glycosyl transferases group 1 [Solimicrobium silvestre]